MAGRTRYVVVAVATVLAVGLVAVAMQIPAAGSRAARLLSVAHKDKLEYVYMPAAAAKDAKARSPSLPPCILSTSSRLLSLTLSISLDAGRRCSTRCLRSHWTTNSAMGSATTSRARFRPWWRRPTSSFRTGRLSASRCSVVAHARSPCCTPAPHSRARVFGAECARPAVPAC